MNEFEIKKMQELVDKTKPNEQNINNFQEMIQKMCVNVMNDKELIISYWIEMNGEIISRITHEEYSFEDVVKKLEEYMVLKAKATPKKPINAAKMTYIPACPNCDSLLLCCKKDYCDNCGQAIDWSEKE